MHRSRFIPAALAVAIGLYGCGGASDPAPDLRKDAVSAAPVFNPSEGEFPIPNDFLFAQETAGDGTMTAGSDPTNPVITGIDNLDGASTLAHIDIKFDDSLNAAQTLDADAFIVSGGSVIPNPNQNVFLIPLRYPGGDPLNNSGETPTLADAFDYQVWAAKAQAGDMSAQASLAALAVNQEVRADIISLDGGTNNVLRITPLQPLRPKTKYLVVLTNELESASGDPVEESTTYLALSDPDFDFSGNAAGQAAQAAVGGWERLANGYFSFLDQVFQSVGASSSVSRDIVLSYTFTTGSPDTVLEAIAAPSVFFEETFVTSERQDAIGKLVAGTYNLDADNAGLAADPVGAAINSQINQLLTNEGAGWEYFNSTLAAAITADVYTDYADVEDDSSLAHLVQLAAGDAAEAVLNPTVAIDCVDSDAVPGFESIKETAACGAAGLIAQLPIPKTRTTNFYRLDCTGSVATGCASPLGDITLPALVAQGEITLPYYLEEPANAADGTNLVTGSWEADETLYNNLSALIQASGGDALPAFPSNKVTYRIPFPEKKSDVIVPIIVVYPNEAIPVVSRPAGGWPVVIFQHGITTNRGSALPMAAALANACVDPSDPTGNTATGADCYATVVIDQPLHGIQPEGDFGLTSVDDPDAAPDAGGVQIGSNTPSAGLTERHFSFYRGATGLPTPMDYASDTGTTGTLFSNLTSFATGRDNLRQGAVDLMNVLASIKDMDIDEQDADADGNDPDLDTANVYVVGHSLGGVNGIPFLSVNNDTDVQTAQTTLQALITASSGAGTAQAVAPVPIRPSAAAFLNTGGFVTQLLINSPSVYNGAPAILQGLALASDGELVQGTSGLETFMSVLQAHLDSGDSMNFAAGLVEENNTGLLMTEIIGGDTVSVRPADDPDGALVNEEAPSDQTIPNDADATVHTVTGLGPLNLTLQNGFVIDSFATPLAGTEPLLVQMGATKTADLALPSATPVVGVTRFTRGSHGTPVTAGTDVVGGEFVDRFSDQSVFIEMVTEIAGLFTSDGLAITVTNGTVVED